MVCRLLSAIVLVVALSGCAKRETMVQAANRRGILLIGNKDEPADLDPNINEAITTSRILSALFEPLVHYSADGQSIVPAGAASWEIAGDGLTYTFHLRPDAKWSNGAPVTAMDYRDSFLRVIDPKVSAINASYLFSVVGAEDYLTGRLTDPHRVGVEAPDALTLVLRLRYPADYLLKTLTQDPFEPVYLPDLDAHGGRRQRGGPWERPGVLVSNGPFQLAEWKANAYVRVTRNPHYWDAAHVRLNEVRFFPTDDENAEERAFRAGQLHVTYRLPKTKVEGYAAEHPDEVHLVPKLRVDYLSFNVQAAPLSDPRVRRALSLAVDRNRLVHAALGRLGEPAATFVRPGTGGFQPTPRFRFDAAAARAQLAAAGFPGGHGFPNLEFALNGTSGVTLAVAEALQQMWHDVLNVDVHLRPMEFKVYLSVVRDHTFQVLLEGFSPFPDPHDLLAFGVTDDPNNDAGARNPAYDAAFQAADRTVDPARRLQAFDGLEALNAEQVYYAPLFFENQAVLVAPSVRGWRDHPLGDLNWHELFVQP